MYLTRFRDLIKRQRNSLIEDHFPKLQMTNSNNYKIQEGQYKKKTHKVANTKPDKKKNITVSFNVIVG